MPKEKTGILEEVLNLEQQLRKMKKQNPSDPGIGALEADILKKRESGPFQKALEAEEKRMGEELKKLFRA